MRPRAEFLRRPGVIGPLPGPTTVWRPHALTLAVVSALMLSACGTRPPAGDGQPTLAVLATREVALANRPKLKSSEDQAIAAWHALLAANPSATQRAQAMRRLGDLEMDASDQRLISADGPGTPDYRAAVKRYEDYLSTYPQDPDNDRVLYQLARAQEQGGQLEAALKTLDRLVADFPKTAYRDEAQFRRGELLFTARQYAQAETAYTTVLGSAQKNPYRERALYMQGWSRFKQARLEPALDSFLAVLDLKLAHQDERLPLDELPQLSRADRELVEDSFRVTSLALENLSGAETIPGLVKTPARQSYEARIYQQLAALYLKQDRPKDAADTYSAFVKRHPLHVLAPTLQAEVISIHANAGFEQLALQAKKDFVLRYGANSEFQRANPEASAQSQALVKTHLAELARYYHAASQKSHASADVQEAVRWYQAWLSAFPKDAEAPANHFLLAELLFEDKRYEAAAKAYEATAYHYPRHARSADAGYAALLAHAQRVAAATPDSAKALRQGGVDSALRFIQGFDSDSRTPAVMVNAAETLYQLGQADAAAQVAGQLLQRQPPATAEQRRVAWTIHAHTDFEAGRFAAAEKAYGEVLALTVPNATQRKDLTERLAASVYKQAEQARDAGNSQGAAELFTRVGSVAPQSSVAVAAQFDAAAQLIALKKWPEATQVLVDFRSRYPRDALQAQIPAKLALVYTEQAQWALAAAEFERIAQTEAQPERARAALWQAADLYDKAMAKASNPAAARAQASKTWERYLRSYPQPLESALEARNHLAQLALADSQPAKAMTWQREILQADQNGGAARTPRTRTLGAQAALALAGPELEAYKKIALVEPLQKQLKLKKTKLEEVLKAYNLAADYGVAEVVTASTYQIAALYQDFAKALLGSQRPKKLSKAELEQYDVLLEEQAYPFEEKATALHEINAHRAAEGFYDSWVQQSFTALRALRPVRWGKTERVDSNPAASANPAAQLNQQAVAARQRGEFKQSLALYEQALKQDASYAPAVLNLGVLYDLYLDDKTQAQAQYERYLVLTPAGDATVTKWVAELKNRKPAAKAPT